MSVITYDIKKNMKGTWKKNKLYKKKGEALETYFEKISDAKRSAKFTQFYTIFHILKQGRPTVDFMNFKTLYQRVKLQNVLQKHWSESSAWKMEKYLSIVEIEN